MQEVVLITGSRSIQHSKNIPLLIDSLIKRNARIIVGDAPGVDRLVVLEAIKRGFGSQVTVVGAYGECRSAYAIEKVGSIIKLNVGYLQRNLYMVGLARECVAFWDGRSRGTKFTFETAKKAGLKVKVYLEKSGGR